MGATKTNASMFLSGMDLVGNYFQMCNAGASFVGCQRNFTVLSYGKSRTEDNELENFTLLIPIVFLEFALIEIPNATEQSNPRRPRRPITPT
jgi:hypothetical protein